MHICFYFPASHITMVKPPNSRCFLTCPPCASSSAEPRGAGQRLDEDASRTRECMEPQDFDEQPRLAALCALGMLDTPPEPRFDRFTALAERRLRCADRTGVAGRRPAPVVQVALRPGCHRNAALDGLLQLRHPGPRHLRGRRHPARSTLRRQSAGHRQPAHPFLRGPPGAHGRRPRRRHPVHHRYRTAHPAGRATRHAALARRDGRSRTQSRHRGAGARHRRGGAARNERHAGRAGGPSAPWPWWKKTRRSTARFASARMSRRACGAAKSVSAP